MKRLALRILLLLLPLFLLTQLIVYAINLLSFAAAWSGSQVVVTWTTSSEINTVGFKILRSTTSNGTFVYISGLIPSECIGCIGGASYSFNDTNVTKSQIYYYKLAAIDTNGTEELFGPVAAPPPAPTAVPTPTGTWTPAPPPPKPTPTPISGGEWKDDLYSSWQLSTTTNVQNSGSRLILKFTEMLDWKQTWDVHFATGEFWHTEAISDSVQLALNGPNQYFTTGVYTSTVFDAARPVDWDSARWINSGLPYSVTLEFRAGNIFPPDSSWSNWLAPKRVYREIFCVIMIDGNQTDCSSYLPGIESSRYLQYRVIFDNNDPSGTLTFNEITVNYGIHPPTGSAITFPLSPSDLREWKEVFYTSTVPLNTTLVIDVLSNDSAVLLSNVNSGASLASINPTLFPWIKLRATFQTSDPSRTPELDLWGVRWLVGWKEYFPIILR